MGQARLLANRLAREYGVPAAVGVVDAQGVAKVSWAAPNDKLAFGQRALDQPKLRRMAKQACSFEETDEQGNKRALRSRRPHRRFVRLLSERKV